MGRESGEAVQTKEMGRGEERWLNRFRKLPHQMGEEGKELPWARPASVLNHGLSEDNFGIADTSLELP